MSKQLQVIKNIEALLKPTDKARIAAMSKATRIQVSRFFQGAQGPLYRQILVAAISVARANKEADKTVTDFEKELESI